MAPAPVSAGFRTSARTRYSQSSPIGPTRDSLRREKAISQGIRSPAPGEERDFDPETAGELPVRQPAHDPAAPVVPVAVQDVVVHAPDQRPEGELQAPLDPGEPGMGGAE